MKSYVFLFACILFLLLQLNPQHLFALSCAELSEEIWLTCQEGTCRAFSVEQRPRGGGCRVLPYVVDLDSQTSQQIHQRLHLVSSEVENTGFWQARLIGGCAYSIRKGVTIQKRLEEALRIACGKSHQAELNSLERLTIVELDNQFNESAWRSRHDNEVANAATIRRSFYFFESLRIIGSILVGGIIPFAVIVHYIRTRKYLFLKLIVLFSVAQAGFVFFLLFYASAYADWAVLSLLVIIILFLLGLGLLGKGYLTTRAKVDK